MREIRRIIFSNDEVLSAFAAYSRKVPSFLPPGRLISCAPIGWAGTESEVRVRVETTVGATVREIEIICRGTEVLQPLILCCLENNIPLSREGRKAFLVVDSQANLMTDLNLDYDLVFEEAPMRSEDIERIKDSF
jgi:hypothetical protein